MDATSHAKRIWELLPGAYRARDEKRGSPLGALLELIAAQLDGVDADVAALYDEWFVETSDAWTVVYTGDFLGARGAAALISVRPARDDQGSPTDFSIGAHAYRVSEDDSIREPALGGADVAARRKASWRVRLTDPATGSEGYRGAENRLYRVEIHDRRSETDGFVWSRDNGSVVAVLGRSRPRPRPRRRCRLRRR